MLKDIFTDIYRNKKWADTCGSGSTYEYTQQLIPKLQGIIYRYNVKTLLDAPCGLYRWIDQIQVKNYIGGDIVSDIVEENTRNFPMMKFGELDITKDRLPPADLWLCRSCLYHLSEDNIRKTIQNYMRSDIPLVAFTVSKDHQVDGEDGGYRPFDLRGSPFFFPQPIELFDDGPLMKMGLWRKEQLMLE